MIQNSLLVGMVSMLLQFSLQTSLDMKAMGGMVKESRHLA